MPYCPSCGTEHATEDAYCRECGTHVGADDAAHAGPSGSTSHGEHSASPDGDADPGTDAGWNWLDPHGPFRSPRNVLNTINTIGVLLLVVGLGLSLAGMEAPYAVLPSPLPILLVVYILAVVFVGLPVWVVLLVTDNVLGFLRKG